MDTGVAVACDRLRCDRKSAAGTFLRPRGNSGASDCGGAVVAVCADCVSGQPCGGCGRDAAVGHWLCSPGHAAQSRGCGTVARTPQELCLRAVLRRVWPWLADRQHRDWPAVSAIAERNGQLRSCGATRIDAAVCDRASQPLLISLSGASTMCRT